MYTIILISNERNVLNVPSNAPMSNWMMTKMAKTMKTMKKMMYWVGWWVDRSVKTVVPAVIWTGTNGMLSFPMTGAYTDAPRCTLHVHCMALCAPITASLCPTSQFPAHWCLSADCSLSCRGLAYAGGLVHTSGLDWGLVYYTCGSAYTGGLVYTGELVHAC